MKIQILGYFFIIKLKKNYNLTNSTPVYNVPSNYIINNSKQKYIDLHKNNFSNQEYDYISNPFYHNY
jgi:hypothetical protein